ncbi:MAG: RNA-protein complex protein Nop10 [Candidatus Altiarchaeota archaeon]
MNNMLKCEKCGEYTLKSACPKCGARAKTVVPPKYSPEDKYGEYRRRMTALIEDG